MKMSLAAGILATVASAGPALAADPAWTPAIEVGVNLSSFHLGDSAAEAYSHRTGFYAGATLSVSGPRLGVRTGVLLTRKGANIPVDARSIRIDYLEVPALLVARLPSLLVVRPLVLGGLAFGWRVAAHSSRSPEPSLRSGDVGAVLGLGVELSTFAVEGKYTWGLRGVDAGRPFSQRTNRVWSFGVRLLL